MCSLPRSSRRTVSRKRRLTDPDDRSAGPEDPRGPRCRSKVKCTGQEKYASVLCLGVEIVRGGAVLGYNTENKPFVKVYLSLPTLVPSTKTLPQRGRRRRQRRRLARADV